MPGYDPIVFANPEGATGYLQWTLPYGGFSGGNWISSIP